MARTTGAWATPFGAWLSGMLALQLHCPILGNEHQWLGHFGVLAPVLVLWMGLAYGRRVTESMSR